MKKIAMSALLVAAVTNIAIADMQNDENNYYFRLDAGKIFTKKVNDEERYSNGKLGNKAIISFGAGLNLDNNIRTDLVITQRNFKLKNDIKLSSTTIRSQKIKSTSLLLNGYYDFKFSETIIPYFQAGVGLARNKSNKLLINLDNGTLIETYPSKTKTSLAWQIGAGVTVKAADSTDLDFGYKFVNLGKTETNKGISTDKFGDTEPLKAAKAKLKGHEVTAGIRFNF